MKNMVFVCSIVVVAAMAVAAVPQGVLAQPDSAQQAEMMAKWMAYATPGEPHKEMAKLAGDWSAKIKMWEVPGMPAQESTGKARFSMIMGGRYMKLDFEGSVPGMPQKFHGMGITAYDNLRREFTDIWFDDMSTGIMVSHGTMGDDGHIHMKGSAVDVMTDRKDVPIRSEAYPVNDSTHFFKMWSTDPGGTEFLSMEITYTRAKK